VPITLPEFQEEKMDGEDELQAELDNVQSEDDNDD
jgi:hypothetical protein